MKLHCARCGMWNGVSGRGRCMAVATTKKVAKYVMGHERKKPAMAGSIRQLTKTLLCQTLFHCRITDLIERLEGARRDL